MSSQEVLAGIRPGSEGVGGLLLGVSISKKFHSIINIPPPHPWSLERIVSNPGLGSDLWNFLSSHLVLECLHLVITTVQVSPPHSLVFGLSSDWKHTRIYWV